MKLLLDENLSFRLLDRLSGWCPGSSHVDDLGMRGKPDREIWNFAATQGFVIVSKDNDFRQLSFLHGAPPKVLWLSVGNAGTDRIAELLEGSRDRIATFAERPEDALLVLALRDE